MLQRARGIVLLTALVGSGAVSALTAEELRLRVQNAFAAGSSANEVIADLLASGEALERATLAAIDATEGNFQQAVAIAGICASSDRQQAMTVAKAAEGAAVAQPLVLDMQAAASAFDQGYCESLVERQPPSGYSSSQLPGAGGGVSPSN
jgi:hypothetical protein